MTATFGRSILGILKSAMNKCFFIGVLGFALSFPVFGAFKPPKIVACYPILLAVTLSVLRLSASSGSKKINRHSIYRNFYHYYRHCSFGPNISLFEKFIRMRKNHLIIGY